MGSDDWHVKAAASVRVHGLVVLRATGSLQVPRELCEQCRRSAESRLERLLAFAQSDACGIDTAKAIFRYREIAHRTPWALRYELAIPCSLLEEDPVGEDTLGGAADQAARQDEARAWTSLHASVDDLLRPLMAAWARSAGASTTSVAAAGAAALGDGDGGDRSGAAAVARSRVTCTLDEWQEDDETTSLARLPRPNAAGCHVSRPCSRCQLWHSDGEQPILAVFVPLTAVTAKNGPTQFRPGTHEPSCDATPRWTLAHDADTTITPEYAPGDLLVCTRARAAPSSTRACGTEAV